MNHLTSIFCLVFLVLFSCEKQESIISPARGAQTEVDFRAGDECSFNDIHIPVKIVNFCGTDFVFQASLELLNNGNFHWIRSNAKCYKLGGDPNDLVDYAELEVEVDGTMSIGCGQTYFVQEPSVYNKNLVAGEVPFKSHCNDCGSTGVKIDYFKDVSLKDDELIKANCRLKLEGCGEVAEEFITVVLE